MLNFPTTKLYLRYYKIDNRVESLCPVNMCYLTITQAKRVTDGCRCVERSQLMLEKTLIFPPNSYGCLRNLSSLVEDISQLHSHIIFFSYFQLNSGEWSVQSNTCRTKHSLFNDSCQLNCVSQVTLSRKLSNVKNL